MTDLELIQLLQEKSAGELSPPEIAAIRARWTQSPELRQALVEHLHLESQLLGVLGSKPLDVDTILKRASEKRKNRLTSRASLAWMIGLSLLLMIAAGIGMFLGTPRPQEPQIEGVAETLISKEIDISGNDANHVAASQESGQPSDATTIDGEKSNQAVATQTSPQHETTMPQVAKPVVVAAAPHEPWSAAFSLETPPWAVNSPKLTADYKAAGHDEFPDSEAKRWLAEVEGQPFGWSTDAVSNPVRRIARFNGIAKLRAPWPSDAVLRMTPFEVTDLTLYFWNGPTGVAFRFYTRREPHLWAAFEIVRENSSPKPTRWGLLTTDNGSYTRSTPGTFDVRQQGDELVLARGGVILMSVPFAGSPLEVFVEGQFRLRGLSMHRSVPFPSPPTSSHPTVVSGPAASLPWAISAESPASLTENGDGSVTMTVDSKEKTGIVSLPFGWLLATARSGRSQGLFEVIVCVESADPGTGIFLGDRNGRPVQRLGFFRDGSSKQITFGTLRPGDQNTEVNYNPSDYPPPYLAKPGWLKMTAGLGTMHIQTSGDGRHWGHVVENPIRDWPGAVASMGLFGLQGPNPRSIRVRHVQVRELNGLTDLADPTLRSLVTPFRDEHFRDLSVWTHQVLDRQPVGTDTSAWLTANAVVALSQGPPKELGLSLLKQLIAVGMESALPFEKKRQLIDDACSLCDLFDEGAARTPGNWYEQLGWQLAKSGDANPLARLRPAWLRSPIWTSSKMRSVWEQLHSSEIVQSVYRRDWPATWSLSQSALYWNLLPNPDQRPTERGEELDRHARWAKSLVAEFAPQLDDGTAGLLPAGLRHSLVPVLNKEAYNLRAELQAALSGGTYEDACRILLSVGSIEGPGLLPDLEDRDLFVSLQTAIATARKAYRGFAETMTEKFEPLGMIRVRSAINRRDFTGLQSATLQFMGTDAAREARVWLGDTAMSVGKFEEAEQHFRESLFEANTVQREKLEPRLLLARALAGLISEPQLLASLAETSHRSFDLNGTIVSRLEWEAVVKDAIARPVLAGAITESIRPPVIPFDWSGYRLESRSQFDGHPGNNPGRWEYRFGDPFGRQLSTVTDGRMIYVSNRFQVNGYLAATGQQVWAQGLGSEQGEAYAMPFTPMKPLLAGDRLFVRRLTKAGAELACLNSTDGQVLWHQRPFERILTDPVAWNGKLFAIVLKKVEDELDQVEAAWFDSSNGNVISTRSLFRLRESAEHQFSAQLTIDDRVAVCTVAGTTASFDSQGELRWLRRHLQMLKPVDELSEDFRMAAPVIRAGHVFVSNPGVRAISCLEFDTGRTVWEQPLTNLRGLIDVTQSRVLADTVAGLVALDVSTGQVVWMYDSVSRLEGIVIDDSKVLLTSRTTFPNNRSKPILVWLDLRSGEQLGQTLIEIGEREECQVGPIFSADGKWWTFVGQSWKDPKRELHQFVLNPSTSPESFRDNTLQAWRSDMMESQLAEIASVVPGWFPACNYRERISIHRSEIRGESFPLLSRLEPSHEVRFVRRVDLVAGRKHTLRLRVGNQPGQQWKLTLRASGQTLLDQVVADAGNPNGWHDVNVDLSSLAGHSISLHLIQSAMNNTPSDALWKRAEFIVE